MRVTTFSFTPSNTYGEFFTRLADCVSLGLVIQSEDLIRSEGIVRFKEKFDTNRLPVYVLVDILVSGKPTPEKVDELSQYFKDSNGIYLHFKEGEDFSEERINIVRGGEPRDFRVRCCSEITSQITRSVLANLVGQDWGHFTEDVEDIVIDASTLGKESLAFLQRPSTSWF